MRQRCNSLFKQESPRPQERQAFSHKLRGKFLITHYTATNPQTCMHTYMCISPKFRCFLFLSVTPSDKIQQHFCFIYQFDTAVCHGWSTTTREHQRHELAGNQQSDCLNQTCLTFLKPWAGYQCHIPSPAAPLWAARPQQGCLHLGGPVDQAVWRLPATQLHCTHTFLTFHVDLWYSL